MSIFVLQLVILCREKSSMGVSLLQRKDKKEPGERSQGWGIDRAQMNKVCERKNRQLPFGICDALITLQFWIWKRRKSKT